MLAWWLQEISCDYNFQFAWYRNCHSQLTVEWSICLIAYVKERGKEKQNIQKRQKWGLFKHKEVFNHLF